MKALNILVEATVAAGSSAGWLDKQVATLVPAGKQLLVEFVSTSSEMPPGQKPNPVIVVLNKKGSVVVQHYPVTFFQLQYSGSDIYKSADPVRMILSRDLTLRVDLTRDASAGAARCFFGISGQIV
jgi:hypothetical protein